MGGVFDRSILQAPGLVAADLEVEIRLVQVMIQQGGQGLVQVVFLKAGRVENLGTGDIQSVGHGGKGSPVWGDRTGPGGRMPNRDSITDRRPRAQFNRLLIRRWAMAGKRRRILCSRFRSRRVITTPGPRGRRLSTTPQGSTIRESP